MSQSHDQKPTREDARVEACPCIDILKAATFTSLAAVGASLAGDDAKAERLNVESDELMSIVQNHANGAIPTDALIEWKRALEAVQV